MTHDAPADRRPAFLPRHLFRFGVRNDSRLAGGRDFVKKLILVALAIPLLFTLGGCAPEIIRAGAERDAVLYGAKIEMERARLEQPVCRIVAVPGEEIMLSGVAEFACYGGSGSGDREITQRVSPAWSFLTQNSGILGMLGFSALMFPDGLNPAPAIVQPEVIPTQVVNPLVVRP